MSGTENETEAGSSQVERLETGHTDISPSLKWQDCPQVYALEMGGAEDS